MKKIFNFLRYHPIYCLFIAICLIFLPGAIVAQPESQTKLIVRALGIDKNGEDYEVSAVVFTPKSSQDFTENYKVVEGKGGSLYEAVVAVGIELGREIGLAHTGVVFVNDEVCESGLIESLDYLIRDYSLGNDTFIVYVPDSSKDMIKQVNSLNQESGIKVSNIAQYDEHSVVLQKSNLESIFDSSYSPSKCVFMNVFELSEEDGLEAGGESGGSTGGSGGGAGGGESGDSGGGSEQKKKILNEGKALIVKEGKKALLLEKEEIDKFKFTKNFSWADVLKIENFSDENFQNANIIFTAMKNTVKYKTYFENEIPVCKIEMNPFLSIAEVNQESLNDNIYVGQNKHSSKKLLNAVNTKIESEVEEIMNKLIENNLDVNLIYEYFNANHYKQFQKFLSGLENQDDFLKYIKFEYKCNAIIN